MKIIFLDIDGVLNSLGSVIALGDPNNHFDMVSVRLIERVCKETETQIVVSSSWRIGRTTEMLQEEMRRLGAPEIAARIVGRTGDGYNGHRGRQIKEWLETKAPDATFIIVDDDSDMLPAQKPYFVKTSWEDGFRAKHYRDAMKLLDPQHSDSKIIVMADSQAQ